MPADISKLLNDLRQSYPELADEPLLDQIDSAAYELAGEAPAEEPAPEESAEPSEGPEEDEMPEEAAELPEPEFELPPAMMKKRGKSKGPANGSQPPYA